MSEQVLGIPCDIGDTVYKVSVKQQKLTKWYVKAIQKNSNEEGWIVIVKDKNNKYKYVERTFTFDCFGEIVFLNPHEANKALADYSTPKKITLTCKCGHLITKEITGTPKYRRKSIDWLSKQLCPECRNKESEKQGLTLTEMKYSEFKKLYSGHDTKVGSYNAENKTIQVYI